MYALKYTIDYKNANEILTKTLKYLHRNNTSKKSIFKRIQKFLLFNLKMTVERSKRRCFLTLTFIVKSVSKNLLIRILKREIQPHLFRRLEQCSQKQINCETAIEFLKLCQNLELTPTFAKVDHTKSKKWTRSARTFEENVVTEELRQKGKRLTELREEINEIYNEIREKCPPLRFACILRTIVTLRKEQYLQLMNGHTK